jgi:hypothetical protein
MKTSNDFNFYMLLRYTFHYNTVYLTSTASDAAVILGGNFASSL